ncbi:MAG: D-alanyl-D-alanine carboxypeptidase family protein [Verrucomicrobiota bacterium]
MIRRLLCHARFLPLLLLLCLGAGCSTPAPSLNARSGASSGAEEGAGSVSLTPISGEDLRALPTKSGEPSVFGKAYIVVNARSGKVMASRNEHLRLPAASTQKLLTAMTVMEGNLDQTITVSASDTYVEPTMMGIKPGERYRKRDLLEAMVVRSSNDIATCLARCHSGSEARFVQAMNAKARSLGMNNSRFANAHGLTAPGSYSTAYDLAILGRAAMNHSYLHRLTQIEDMVFRFADGRTKQIWNTNRVLKMTPYCTGLKTGYTSAAGRCLVSSGSRAGKKVVVVVLGSKQPDVWIDSYNLLHWALDVPEAT